MRASVWASPGTGSSTDYSRNAGPGLDRPYVAAQRARRDGAPAPPDVPPDAAIPATHRLQLYPAVGFPFTRTIKIRDSSMFVKRKVVA
jgi:hypothetical protein